MEIVTVVAVAAIVLGIPASFAVNCWKQTKEDAEALKPKRTFWRYEWGDLGRCPAEPCRGTGDGKCGFCGLRTRPDYDPDYSFWKYREGFLCRRDEGPLVASLCENGRHAPAIDLDFPVTGSLGPEGGRILLHRPVAKEMAIRVLKAFADARVVSDEFAHERIAELSGLDFGGYRASAQMLDMLGLNVIVPGKVVPSSTVGHHHLYLDIEMEWDDYERLLRVLADAGYVEREYHEMSVHRKKTLLRKPGVSKEDPAAGRLPPGAWRFETPKGS